LQETTGTQKLAFGAKSGSVIIAGDSSFFKQTKEKKLFLFLVVKLEYDL
jgi:hypothetical protein